MRPPVVDVTSEELAVFAEAMARGLVEDADRAHGIRVTSEQASGPGGVCGVRLVGELGDVLAHAVPVSFEEWELRLWFADAPGDEVTARLALTVAEATQEPVLMRVNVVPWESMLSDSALAAQEWNERVSRQLHQLDRTDPQRRGLISRHFTRLHKALDGARFTAAWEPLEQASTGLRVVATGFGGGDEFEIFGTWHGEYDFHLDIARGRARLRVSSRRSREKDRPYWQASLPYTPACPTQVTHFEAARLLPRLAALLERAPFEYGFRVTNAADGEEVRGAMGWGHSEAEAREALKARWATMYGSYGSRSGVPVEELVFTALGNGDDRKFPEQMPDFTFCLERR